MILATALVAQSSPPVSDEMKRRMVEQQPTVAQPQLVPIGEVARLRRLALTLQLALLDREVCDGHKATQCSPDWETGMLRLSVQPPAERPEKGK